MDASLFVAGKAKGQSAIALHGKSTLLVSLPGGYDPKTGEALPPVERGYQRADLAAMREAAAQAVIAAQKALDDAQANLAAFDTVLAEADAVLGAK